MNEPRLLLVEDEPVTRMALDARLRAAGFRVTGEASAERALARLRAEQYAVMVTDLIFQQLDGEALLREARGIDPDLEMIVLTGAATLDSAIAAVNHGAHSYLRKPAQPGQLEERVAAALERRRLRAEERALLRQLSAQLLRIADPRGAPYDAFGAGRLRVGPLVLDVQQRRATVNGRSVALSSSEFDLLVYLAKRADQVLSAEQLAREALGYLGCNPGEARELIKVRVHRIRHKIERDPRTPRLLICVRGAGYMLSAVDAAA